MEKLQPAFATIKSFVLISGLSRTAVYEQIGLGNLRAVKSGRRVLVDVKAGLAWIASLPAAQIAPPKERDRSGRG